MSPFVASLLSFGFDMSHVPMLVNTTCTNVPQVASSVNFIEASKNPYHAGYDKNPPREDTVIDYETKCYASFEVPVSKFHEQRKKGAKLRYSLHSLTPAAADKKASTHLTHHGPCGVCSTLQDLSVYLLKPDLTNPVRRCALKSVFSFGLSDRKACIQSLGFTSECAWIWYWNTINTGKSHRNGGCKGTCMVHWAMGVPNNVPVGVDNPCQPLSEEGQTAEERLGASAASAAASAGAVSRCGVSGPSSGPSKSTKKSKGNCGNTINGKPACHKDMWQSGPARMSSCLQCDECRSGPIFQKVAGRTRRASGIKSAIVRPDFKEVEHTYII
uniref:Uncharacterized protein n=1 Tax=Coccolithus braarudii TaxID=221442 RepID=A0A7S0LQ78_9EUKA|mmetsp:Transcript_50824/g.108522  ORF Transcript_50824/g.108522 Transcript_50824/m.108522 type:complete len:329 (+) Transcript_50824:17-1003(+)|eukprot:CAMPEP_0183335904 /NCGR_PEP_ID=MMETSP0164_2-20130417/4045_1 /TAXON_ID=221442 /ORGANISM="Coccolithus pelagicus ssp braarudi, Strain PLY182g" /LENGTH=328 /DNA_ID=CAMNT_0025505333 /DNA_START=17 /DNA_END=1003 /DNA_ORIENTATION=-